ncbi:MAG: tetratricopeptide repeat protein, partial [Planctomycetaceae bacterium]
DPRNKTLSYFLAEQYETQDQLDEAESLFTETLGRSNDPRGLVGLASVHRRQLKAKPLLEDLGKAFQFLERFVVEADNPQVLERMDSDTRAVVQRYGELEAEIAADEKVMDALIGYGEELLAEAEPKVDFVQAYLLGKLSVEAERIDAAQKFYQLAIDMQNDPPPQLFEELGLALTGADRYKEAASVFQQMLEHTSPRLQRPDVRFKVLFYQSHALAMDGQTDGALKAIGEARQILPENALLHFQEAWVYYHAQRWPEAIAKFEEVIETHKNSDDPTAVKAVRDSRFSLSAVYVQLDNFPKGEEVLLAVLEQEPDHPQVNNDLGYLWADQGKNLEQARGMIEKALAAEGDNPAYLDSMGWVLFKLGEYDKARENLERAVGLERGQDSVIWDHLGDTYDHLGQTGKAQDAWRKALEIEQGKTPPDDKILKRLQEKVPAKTASSPN